MTSRTPIFSRTLTTVIGGLALTLGNLGVAQAATSPDAPSPAPELRPALRGEQNLGPFSLFDTDHDGTLSAAEIDAAAQVLRQFDKNHDGNLTAAELPQRRPPPPHNRRPGANDEAPAPPTP